MICCTRQRAQHPLATRCLSLAAGSFTPITANMSELWYQRLHCNGIYAKATILSLRYPIFLSLPLLRAPHPALPLYDPPGHIAPPPGRARVPSASARRPRRRRVFLQTRAMHPRRPLTRCLTGWGTFFLSRICLPRCLAVPRIACMRTASEHSASEVFM